MRTKFKKLLSSIYIIISLINLFWLAGCATHTRTEIKVINEFDQSEKPKVAVLDFKPDLSIKEKKSKPFVAGLFNNPDAGHMLANIFSQELSKSDLFVVVGRKDVIKKLEESGYNRINGIDDYSSLGKILGVDAIITGTFKRFGFLYPTIVPRILVKFYAEYIDLKTTNKIWSVRIKDQSSTEVDERDLARKQIKEAIKRLEKRLYYQKQ